MPALRQAALTNQATSVLGVLRPSIRRGKGKHVQLPSESTGSHSLLQLIVQTLKGWNVDGPRRMPSSTEIAPVSPGVFPPETAHLVAAWTEVRFVDLIPSALTDPSNDSLGPSLWCDNQY